MLRGIVVRTIVVHTYLLRLTTHAYGGTTDERRADARCACPTLFCCCLAHGRPDGLDRRRRGAASLRGLPDGQRADWMRGSRGHRAGGRAERCPTASWGLGHPPPGPARGA